MQFIFYFKLYFFYNTIYPFAIQIESLFDTRTNKGRRFQVAHRNGNKEEENLRRDVSRWRPDSVEMADEVEQVGSLLLNCDVLLASGLWVQIPNSCKQA